MKKLILLVALALTSFGCYAQNSEKQMTQQELQQALVPLFTELQKITESEDSVKTACMDFVQKNQTQAGAYVLCNILPQVAKTDDLVQFINTSDYYKSNEQVKNSMKVWDIQKATGEGKMFVDFSAEYEGKTQKLSDYVGKGKYVLVDFWASWCGPCKAEIPNLINVYNKYKGDKFEVLGVATWDKPDATKQAMEKLGIPYPQIMNAQKAGSDAYGIQGIPQIILFGPDGTILKRNLRGEAVEKAVEEYLAK